MIEKYKTLPRWVIFLLDLCVVAFALLSAQIIRFNFHADIAFDDFLFPLLVVLAINATLFFLFKSFSGIVRYTTIRDTFRLTAITFIASIIYSVIGLIYYSKGVFFLSRATILINFFVATSLLIGYRMAVRYLYRIFFRDNLQRNHIRVAVFDTGEQGLLAKRVITDYPQSQMLAVAFLDNKLNQHGKQMEGLPIYNLEDATFKKLVADDVKRIIIASKRIKSEELNFIVDKALEYDIRVQQIPPVSQWLRGKLGSEQLKDINIEDLLERDVIKINNENIFYAIKGKKVLVTGAAGSIGSEMVRQLVQFKPSLIIVCDKAETPMHEIMLELQEKWPDAPVKSYVGDICDRVRMEHLFEVYNPEFVFHAAAYKHVPLMEENPSMAVVNNVMGTKIISELSVQFGVEKFVMVSTDKAVNPTNVMGASKRIAEIFTQSLFRHHHAIAGNGRCTRFITTRFGNVLGSNGSVIPRFKNQIEKGGPITVTHPDITRYFMTIPEACQLVIEAGVMGVGGEIFVFDMGKPVKVVELAEKMIRLSGKQPGIDIDIAFTGLRPGEKLYEELLSNKENTMPTYHEKIMIAKVREYDFSSVTEQIDKLLDCATKHYTYETVGVMKEIVPEYISQNSTFESLDVKKK
ncbi:MAG: polysaccharide biosynthesis protein [Bacteroidetes bacterium]|nr:polysaccharide biosynthesis protein [Bacteroidota bacterium]MBS1740270.1 polysaccharide biosynthesis protein [Bacteroidota bacterium]MBS1776484.1 polysaccharide biosynthesis protein [Bacteroidota bacterium]